MPESHLQKDITAVLKVIPRSSKCCLFISVETGTRIIAILGICSVLSITVLLFLRHRDTLTLSTLILIFLLSIFILVTSIFVIASAMLLIGVNRRDPRLLAYYILLTIFFLIVQFILAIAIPLLLIFEEIHEPAVGLSWMVLAFILIFLWTHYLAVVKTYRRRILSGDKQ